LRGWRNTDSDTYGYGNSHSYSDGYSYSYGYSYGYGYRYRYGYRTVQNDAYAKASWDSATAAIAGLGTVL
jgi:hypothetical protein